MNVNIKIPDTLQERIVAVTQANLSVMIEDILQDQEMIEKIVRETLKNQVKHITLQAIQSNELRSDIWQKVYPIVYKSLALEETK